MAVFENSIAGTGNAGNGVLTEGKVASISVTHNNIRGFAAGVNLTNSPKFAADGASNASVTENQLVDNGATIKTGLRTDSSATGTAAGDNWWGCNAGPKNVGTAPVAADCDSIVNVAPSTATLPSWVVLGIDATPPSLAVDGSATVTASLNENNLGNATTGVFPDGSLLGASGTGGAVSSPTAATTAQIATFDFVSTGFTSRSASATKDHQTITYVWPDMSLVPPAISITSPADGTTVSAETHPSPSVCSDEPVPIPIRTAHRRTERRSLSRWARTRSPSRAPTHTAVR